MESNNKLSNQKDNNSISNIIKRGTAEINMKMFIFAFLALLLACIIPYIVKIIDIIILLIIGINSPEIRGSYSFEEVLSQDFNQPMNLAYIMAATYILYNFVFGLWYSRYMTKKDAPDKKTDAKKLSTYVKESLIRLFKSPIAYLLIVGGYAGQIMVDSILNLCRDFFPDAFAEYDALVSSAVGATSSVVMLISVFVLAPIGEELLFRGLIQRFLTDGVSGVPIAPVIVIQGICFGVYHGNIIQCIYATILGILLGYIAYKADNLIPCIVFHMALNISVCLVPSIWFEFTSNCVIAGIISTIVFIVTMLLVCKLFHKDQDDKLEA